MALFSRLAQLDKRQSQISPWSSLMPSDSLSNLSAGRIALGYAFIAILWIVFSDAIVDRFRLPAALMTIKGAVFVFVTALLLYVTIRRLVQTVRLASEGLRQTQVYLAEAQRLTHTGSWALDLASGEYAYWSDEMFRIFAFDPQLGPPKVAEVLKRIEPKDRANIERNIRTSLLQKDTAFEFKLVSPDGRLKHIHCLTSPVLSTKGEVVEVVGTVVDITERKRAEEAFRESEMRFRTLWDHAVDAFALFDEQNRLIDVNQEACDSSGYTREEVIGMVPQDFNPDIDAAMLQTINERIGAGEICTFESRHRRKDGTVFPVEVRVRQFCHGGRRLHLAVSRDITERKRAEEERRQSAERFRAVADYTYDWENWFGVDGKLLWVNPAVERITGYSVDDCMGMPDFPLSLVADPDRQIVVSLMREAVQGSSRNDVEFRVRRKDGQLAWVAASWQPIYDSQGARLGYRSSIRDIAERKRAEEALRDANAYNRSLIEASLDPLVTIDPEGRITDVNAATEQLTGYPRSELVATDFSDYFAEPNKARAGYQQVFKEGFVRDYELDIRHRSGHSTPVLYNASVYKDETGNVIGVFAAARDITVRKRAEEALRESDTRFRTFMDHAADAFFMLDFEQGTIVDLNRRACESLGYTREELIGETPLLFDMTLDRASLDSLPERTAAGETVLFARHWHRRKDGSVFPVEVHTSLFWHCGRRMLLKGARDISDRVQAEEQAEMLRQLEVDLAHINRVSMMGELVASIAHEVNQPISGVVSNAGACLRWLTREVPDLEEAKEAVRRIVRDGKRAGEVIARIRTQTKRAELPAEKLDVSQLIVEVLALVRDEAQRKNVTIRMECANDVQPVSGDRVQLQQVVLNLVMNGIEAMSSVHNRARELVIAACNLDTDTVQICVQDSGIGLNPDLTERIFEPFYTTKRDGMGMGLAVCRSIIRNHGGRLWAVSNTGYGASLLVTLPTYREQGSHAATAGN